MGYASRVRMEQWCRRTPERVPARPPAAAASAMRKLQAGGPGLPMMRKTHKSSSGAICRAVHSRGR